MTVVAGPARCGKTQRLLAAYRPVLAERPLGAGLWLAANHRAAATIREEILAAGEPGCLSPNVLTFDQFARRVLDASALSIRPISPLGQRQILNNLIADALARGALPYFEPIARTSGFLDLLTRFVQELKRLEIWPEELRAACGPRATEKDQELCLLYGAYQRLLTDHHLYDAQGRFWSARAQLRDGQRRPFERLRHVFVDGFSDFTRTEHEMLEILAGRVESLTISLTLELDSARRDLFSKSAKTLAELQKRHAGVSLESMPRLAATWPAMDHLERYLFANPRTIPPASDTAGLEIITASGATAEIELLARRVKRLLVHGDDAVGGAPVRPGEILVVFRSLADSAELVREVFTEFGIPAAIGSGPALERAPHLSALVAWLRLGLADWPYRPLLGMLVHNYFRPSWPEWQQGRAVVAAEYLARHLQIPSGRAVLLAQAERLAARGADKRASAKRIRLIERQAELACPLLGRLGRVFEQLPSSGTLSEWTRAISGFADELGLLQPETGDAGPQLAEERAAWQQFVAALRASEQLSGWLGRPSVELSGREFVEHLEDVLRSEPMPSSRDEVGRVRVLSAESARHLSAPYVFMAGLSEKAFPPPDRDDCITSEAANRQLVSAGLPLVLPSERRRQEMLLFYEAATRATRRLVLSYPALDLAAQPLSPSPYLSEIERAFAPLAITRHEQPDLSGVPTSDEVLCPRDFRVRAVAQALLGDGTLVASLRRDASTARAAANLLASLQASCARQRGEAFGPFEGLLTSEAALKALGEQFGPDHCWSPSQIEQYALCPHQFFLERVLRVDALDEPALEVDYAGRGRMLHWLLAALHRGLNERYQSRTSPGDLAEPEFLKNVSTLVADLLDTMRSDRPLADGLLEIDARRLSAWLNDYRRQHDKYDEAWQGWDAPLRPAHFEVSFGPRRGDAAGPSESPVDTDDPLSRREPFELVCGDQSILFAGRIDRIDLGTIRGQAVFNIVDYKSSASDRKKAKAIDEGYALQLPLYALAAQQLLREQQAFPFSAAYWHVAGQGYKEAIAFRVDADGQLTIKPSWEAQDAALRARVRALVAGIRQGQFPMQSVDNECTSRCAFSTVCRVNQTRALGKHWQPPSEAQQ